MMNETFLGCAPNRTHLFFKDYTSNALEAMRHAAGSTPKPKPKPRPKPKPNPTPTSPNTPQAAPTRGGAVLEQQSSTKRCACIRLGARVPCNPM